MFLISDKETITSIRNGRTVYFGLQDFKERIVYGKHCFICGASPEERQFNDEHVIPNWVLKRFQLHSEQINITDDQSVKYGRYVIPCCKECNEDLGRAIEDPVSELLNKSYNEIAAALKNDNALFHLLFQWMSLLFFKTHFKDTFYRKELDKRINSGQIGDLHDWGAIHHIHCMCRIHYTQALVDSDVFGSLLILPVLSIPGLEFDYTDHMAGKSAMVVLDHVCILAVLDDSGVVTNMFRHFLELIDGPLTQFQLKELFVRMVYGNVHLEPRPIFSSTINADGRYSINVVRPKECRLAKEEIFSAGELLHYYANKFLKDNTPDRDRILVEIKEGKRAYILNEKGEFIQHSL
jgi:hypothetical protein